MTQTETPQPTDALTDAEIDRMELAAAVHDVHAGDYEDDVTRLIAALRSERRRREAFLGYLHAYGENYLGWFEREELARLTSEYAVQP